VSMLALTIAAALSATMAIAAGAFGAHAAQGAAVEWLKTGGFYQLIHAVAILVIMQRFPSAAWLLLVGSLIFSVSLYAMALGAPRWFGAITPIGGTVMIFGWLTCAYNAWRSGG
jgi:uncharacterized membrane protein YgdD (TMEM256/DUF423 family)